MDFVVISTAYNAQDYVARCLESVARQRVPVGHTLRHVYISDCSTDATVERAYDWANTITPSRGFGDSLDFRPDGYGSGLENLYHTVQQLEPADIVLSVDGDDWLPHAGVIERLAWTYEAGAWMTYGSFIHADGTPGWATEYSAACVESAGYRRDTWRATHLKTYRAGLFHKIKREHVAPRVGAVRINDMDIMFPMLEMARENAAYIPDILYVYNWGNPLASPHWDLEGQAKMREATLHARGGVCYRRRMERPW